MIRATIRENPKSASLSAQQTQHPQSQLAKLQERLRCVNFFVDFFVFRIEQFSLDLFIVVFLISFSAFLRPKRSSPNGPASSNSNTGSIRVYSSNQAHSSAVK